MSDEREESAGFVQDLMLKLACFAKESSQEFLKACDLENTFSEFQLNHGQHKFRVKVKSEESNAGDSPASKIKFQYYTRGNHFNHQSDNFNPQLFIDAKFKSESIGITHRSSSRSPFSQRASSFQPTHHEIKLESFEIGSDTFVQEDTRRKLSVRIPIYPDLDDKKKAVKRLARAYAQVAGIDEEMIMAVLKTHDPPECEL